MGSGMEQLEERRLWARTARTRLADAISIASLGGKVWCPFLEALGRRAPTGHSCSQHKQDNLPPAELTIQYKLGCTRVYGTSVLRPQGFEIPT